jgi:hypothetical protein
MSGLRDEIRAILREEIAALRSGGSSGMPTHETVRIANSADLTRFAQNLIARAADPEFSERVARGELRFELGMAQSIGGPIVTGPAKPAPNVLDKALITERDIAVLDGARMLRIGKGSRLTPLARDEARRRGIRIERSET